MRFYIVEKIQKSQFLWVARSTVWFITPFGFSVPVRSKKVSLSVAYEMSFVARQADLLTAKLRALYPKEKTVPVFTRKYV